MCDSRWVSLEDVSFFQGIVESKHTHTVDKTSNKKTEHTQTHTSKKNIIIITDMSVCGTFGGILKEWNLSGLL